MAEVCELAHAYTKLECDKLGVYDIDEIDSETGDVKYSDFAQKIFDRHFDLITETLGV